jgi:hypothetical protein
VTEVLHVLSRAEAEALVAHAREDFARYLDAAEKALEYRRSQRRTNQLAKQASALAVEAAADILPLAEELEREAKEIDSLHRHLVIAVREECRHKRRADAAEADATWFRAEATRLQALVDQLQAAADAAIV